MVPHACPRGGAGGQRGKGMPPKPIETTLTDNDDTWAGWFDCNDHVEAGRGNNTLDGGGGDDVLIGEAGNDHLIGGKGNDHLFGDFTGDTGHSDEGNDWLEGGDGFD